MRREIGALTTLDSNATPDHPAQRILLPPTRAGPHNINAGGSFSGTWTASQWIEFSEATAITWKSLWVGRELRIDGRWPRVP
jgi:hypothetical protein